MPDLTAEDVLVSERLRHLEEAEDAEHATQAELLGISRETRDGVQRLVQLQEQRDAREAAALEAEQRRLEVSADAETKRVSAEIAEQQARGAWAREQLTRFVGPAVAILGAVGAAVTAWASGLFSGGHR
jgi:hypothetical protein